MTYRKKLIEVVLPLEAISTESARLLGKVGSLGEVARELAYRLYTTCERKGWAEEALAYKNQIVRLHSPLFGDVELGVAI